MAPYTIERIQPGTRSTQSPRRPVPDARPSVPATPEISSEPMIVRPRPGLAESWATNTQVTTAIIT